MLNQANTRIAALDGLRAFAVGMVIFTHYGAHQIPGFRAIESVNIDPGTIGVQLFFVLSGFLITTILVEKYPPSLGVLISFCSFWTSRLFRLMPPVVMALIFCWLFSVHDPARNFYLWNLVFVQNFSVALYKDWMQPLGHFWSLDVEMQFYLLYPFFVWAFRKNLLVALIIALSAVIPIQEAISTLKWLPMPGFLLPFRVDALLLGGILACIARRHDFSSIAKVMFLGASVAYIGQDAMQSGLGAPEFLPTLALGNVFFAGLVGMVLVPHSKLARCLATPVLVHIGRISYSIYIWHLLANYVLQRALGSSGPFHWLAVGMMRVLPIWAVWLVITLAIAEASWFLVEKPMIRIGHRLASSLLATRIVSARVRVGA